MKGIADLHIHSRYSRATSKEGTPEYLDLWARKKGISIVGTGDFTHPAWREELMEKLAPAEDGFYVLKEEYMLDEARKTGASAPRFVVTGEISSIYKKNDKVRKVHNVILLPGLEDAQILSKKLETIGNIHSDGRPILGLDCHDLLEIMLEMCPEGILVPAHIWTPHFALFGAFSGFDTIEECFEDLTPYIHALETGLSSDPPMNWRWSALDRYNLISNSDAHSPAKLGREANLMDIEMCYQGLSRAIQEGKGLEGTIEFFPEEGKYHYDGHRKCHICLSPEQAEKYNGKCPVCGRKMTTGVDHRIVQLADRKDGYVKENAKPFESLVPLPEVIGASTGYSGASRRVQEQYEEMIAKLGPEFHILREIPVEDIRKQSGYLIAEGIRRLREGKVIRRPGFDGEYGTIKLFENDEIQNLDGQMSLFGDMGMERNEATSENGADEGYVPLEEPNAQGNVSHPGYEKQAAKDMKPETVQQNQVIISLNEEQQQAVEAIDRAVAVVAGPGTGKTKTLVSRILYLLEHRKVKPSEITAVTFTNKAAAEMRERLSAQFGNARNVKKMNIGTFHGISLDFLKKYGKEFALAGEDETILLAKRIIDEYRLSLSPGRFLRAVSLWKTGQKEENGLPEYENMEASLKEGMAAYQKNLKEAGKMDFDDLLIETLRIFREELVSEKGKPSSYEQPFSYLLVDEFQDISPVQYDLIRVWNEHGRELFAIGDPDQSIYGFRGSDAHCFERLKVDYPQLRIVTLKENYRSTGNVVKTAVSVISNNPGGERILHANQGEGLPVRIVQAQTKMQESIFTAKEINHLIGGIDMIDVEQQDTFREGTRTWTFKDIAVLYRTHHQAKLLEKCLAREGIPYIITGREDFLETPLIQGTTAFFQSLRSEEEVYKKDAISLLWKLDEDALSESIYQEMREKYSKKFKKQKPKKIIESWMEDIEQKESKELMDLASMAVCYKNMEEFLDALLLGEEGDLHRCGGKSYTADAVHLMTLHGAKGLEFPVVLLYGAGRGELPLENEKYPADTEEERRLFYVGITRAKKELILTYSGEPSAFLEELPASCIVKENAGKKHAKEAAVQLSLFDFI